MRDAFLKSLNHLAQNDKDLILLTADLGFGVFEQFEIDFPNQFFNVGVAEQNMTGLAVGLSLEGKKVVTYSIGNFPILRCLEQIRNDACYHESNLMIVGSGGGFSYGSLGMSHHTTEDIAILRALPSMTVVAPSTAWEAEQATEHLVKKGGVSYLRIDKTAAKEHNNKDRIFQLGKARKHAEGTDITLIATGGILYDAQEAANNLLTLGIKARVLGIHTIKPIDSNEIISAAKETGGIITIEEHNKDGGLGSAVAEVCMDNYIFPRKFLRIGLENTYSSIVGSQQYLKSRYKMDSKAILEATVKLLKGN